MNGCVSVSRTSPDLPDPEAAAIAPHVEATTALVGILRRGAPLARLLAQRLEVSGQRPPEVGELALKRYSDDLAVLCTRGSPTVPVRADFAGKRLDVGPGWIVDCAVPPYDAALGITIRGVREGGD